MASQMINRFHAQLRDYKHLMWRRFEVSKNISTARLAYIVMTLFEMQASHLSSRWAMSWIHRGKVWSSGMILVTDGGYCSRLRTSLRKTWNLAGGPWTY